MNDIVLQNVWKTYGEKTVLRDFSYTFKGGAVTCLEGPSGCGKTTLLRLIAGLTRPDTGSIAGVPEKVSYVFQEDRLCEEFSALGNIRLVCGKTKSKDEIIEHLHELSLAEDIRTPVRTFSGGMKRRVAIARAILYDADCILLDEPFKGLDETLKKTAMEYVIRHTQGKTVLCVTHDPAETVFLGGHLLMLKGPGT